MTLEAIVQGPARIYLQLAPNSQCTIEQITNILTIYQTLQNEGTYTPDRITSLTRETQHLVTRVLNKLGLPTEQQDTTESLTPEDIMKILSTYDALAQQGQPKTAEIAEKTGIKRLQIGRLLKSLKLPYAYGENKSIDEYIQQGLTAQQIADKEGITPQGANQRIHHSGLHEEWRIRREERKYGKKRALQKLANVMYTHLLTRAQTENPVMYYATIHSRTPHPLPYEKLEKLFTAYFQGKAEGKIPTIYDLQEQTGIHFVTIGNILRKNGLERSRQIKTRETTPKHKKQAMNALHAIGLDTTDISNYLTLPDHVVRDTINRQGKQLNRSTPVGRARLHLHHCEEIYEAQQLGYTPEETAQLLDLPEKTIQYALDNKETIEQKIQQAHEILEARKCSTN